MEKHSSRVRTRFAPSPTGLLHIGGLRTALYSYLLAKHHGGDFVLRIEDTDRERLVEGGIDQIMRALEWVGLHVDEGPTNEGSGEFGPYIQSERHKLGIYQRYAQQLVAEGKAYYSGISPDAFAMLKQQAIDEKRPFVYRKSMEPSESVVSTEGLPIRLAVSPGSLEWGDSVHGEFVVDHDIIDDFIIIKADGYPTYNFANVVDDHLMNISHVVRGPEFLASTPKHALLYDYFGWQRPVFAHCPTILGADGKKKLSKRDGDVDALDYRDQGYLPEAMINFLALLGWNDGTTQEVFSLEELIQKFSLDRVQKSPAQFDIERLRWMNGEYIRNVLSQEEYVVAAKQALLKADYGTEGFGDDYIQEVLLLDRERVKVLSDIPEVVEFFFVAPKLSSEIKDLLTKKSSPADVKGWLELVVKSLENTEWQQEQIEASLRTLVSQHDLHAGKLFYAIRVAITGRTAAPGLFETLATLGEAQSVQRLEAAIRVLG